MTRPTDLVQGTLDLLIMRTIAAESLHGCASDQSGLAVSGAPATGTPGLDRRRLGRLRNKPARPILSANRGRPAPTDAGARGLGATLGGDLARHTNRVTGEESTCEFFSRSSRCGVRYSEAHA